MDSRPVIITAVHLTLLAVIYIRQSTLHQVVHNFGSGAVQRALADLPLAWGWPQDRILIIDGDLGRSASRAGKRSGFAQLIALIRAGKIGCVFFEDISRMSRNLREAYEFIDAVIEHNVPVYYSGRVFSADEEELGELLGLQAEVMIAVHEQKSRTLRMKRGKAAKVRAGYAVSPPPIGYIAEVRGKWRKDPSEAVQLVVRLVFVLYLELRSTHKAARALIVRGLTLPRRHRGTLVWDQPSGLAIVRILKNPNYTPDYFYRRTQQRVAPDSGRARTLVRAEADWLIARDHHEGYVTREEFAVVQALIKRNRFSEHGPSRGGRALLARLLECGACGRRLRTPYQRRFKDEHRPAYVCHYMDPRGLAFGLRRCLWLPTEGVDSVVVGQVLQTLTAPSHDDIVAVLREAEGAHRDAETARDAQFQVAEAVVREMRRRYEAVDLANDLVKVEVEQQYQEAIKRRDGLRRQVPETVRLAIGPEDIDELKQLAGDVREIWDAPTTTDQDRQEILRSVLTKVVVTSANVERALLLLVWKGGFTEQLEVLRRQGVAEAIRERRAEGRTDSMIAKDLAAHGFTGRGGGPVTRGIISSRVSRHGLQHRIQWAAGLSRIRELVAVGRTDREVLQELTTNGPRHWRAQWTLRIVQDWITKLTLGDRHGVPRLPAGIQRVGRATTDERIVLFMHRARKGGEPWRRIAVQLNEQGYRRARGESFTETSCIGLYCKWERDGRLARLRRGSGEGHN